MIRYAWGIKNDTTGVTYTSSVLSFSFTNGRQGYLDTYNAGAIVLTIKNQANESAGFNFGDEVQLLEPTGDLAYSFYVVEVTYSDYPGNTGMSTASIICQDALGLMGRLQMNDFAITADDTQNQFTQVTSVDGFIAARPILITSGATGSLCSAGTYSGSVLNFWNLLINTERGLLGVSEGAVIFNTRSGIPTGLSPVSFARTAEALKIGYQSFERINLGLDFMNQVQTEPEGLAVQQATNPTSVATYGAQGFTVSTVDATTSQALDLAQWLASTLSDIDKQRFVVTFTDVMQSVTTTRFADFLLDLSNHSPIQLAYRVPGDASDTVVNVIAEGINVSATPSETTITAFLTPLTYYDYFTLNSAVLGVLDSSRVGF